MCKQQAEPWCHAPCLHTLLPHRPASTSSSKHRSTTLQARLPILAVRECSASSAQHAACTGIPDNNQPAFAVLGLWPALLPVVPTGDRPQALHPVVAKCCLHRQLTLEAGMTATVLSVVDGSLAGYIAVTTCCLRRQEQCQREIACSQCCLSCQLEPCCRLYILLCQPAGCAGTL